MPIGPYSPCVGGTGKKIKFCCPDLLGDLQKIEKMIEGGQFQACLGHVERLEKSNPDKACLLATKIRLLRLVDRYDEATTTARAFLEKHPDNPIALAEAAMSHAFDDRCAEAMSHIARAIERSGAEMYLQVYQSMGVVARVMAALGHHLAAVALASLQLGIRRDDQRPLEILFPFRSETAIPLVLKDNRLRSCPDDAPCKAEFDEAMLSSSRGEWLKTRDGFERIAQRCDLPAVWWNLAMSRSWLADTDGCVEALRRFAASDVPLEDAVEAETFALFISGDPLGDPFDVLEVTFAVDEPERLETALSTSRHFERSPGDPADYADGDGPPPRAVYVLFDREPPGPDAERSLETLPRPLSQVAFYGKETDRPARLVLSDVSAHDLGAIVALLHDVAGDALAPEPEQKVIAQKSTFQELLSREWRLPANTLRSDFERWIEQYLEQLLLETWPQAPLGLLDGKTPEEAAGEEAYRHRLLAGIMVLDHWLQAMGARFDLNRLRGRLGLPTLEPIELGDDSIGDLPLVRLHRVAVDKLPDGSLLAGLRRAIGYGVVAAQAAFAHEIVRRPSLAGHKDRLRAYRVLVHLTEDPDEALRYLEEGRQAAEAASQSSAPWDLAELQLRYMRGEAEELSRVLRHLETEHFREPGVAQGVSEFLMRIGLLRPDGTPAAAARETRSEQPSLVVPGVEGAKPGELWTPDGPKPPGAKPKLWTPGMD